MTDSYDYVVQSIVVDPRYESYQDLFDQQLAESLDAAAAQVPYLVPPTSNLLLQWRGVSYTVTFPASLVDHMSAFAASFVSQQAPHSNIHKLADAVLAQCLLAIPEITSEPSLACKLRNAVLDIAARVPDAYASGTYSLPSAEWWAAYIEKKPFRMTLWSALRIGYMAVFNAYETFVVQCVREITGNATVRSSDRNFVTVIRECLGETVTQRVWSGTDVKTVQLTRHSLAHAGGRVTPGLRDAPHNIRVHEDVLQIMPADIRRTYTTLARAAIDLLESARGTAGPTPRTPR